MKYEGELGAFRTRAVQIKLMDQDTEELMTKQINSDREEKAIEFTEKKADMQLVSTLEAFVSANTTEQKR